jgi:hypothetical protein
VLIIIIVIKRFRPVEFWYRGFQPRSWRVLCYYFSVRVRKALAICRPPVKGTLPNIKHIQLNRNRYRVKTVRVSEAASGSISGQSVWRTYSQCAKWHCGKRISGHYTFIPNPHPSLLKPMMCATGLFRQHATTTKQVARNSTQVC